MTVAVIGLVVALVLTPLLVVAAPKLQLIDVPNERSSHVASVPRAGGIAVAIATVVAVATGDEWSSGLTGLVVVATVLAGVGLVDDRVGLPAPPRLAAQLITPLVVVPLVIDRSGVGTAAQIAAAVVFVAGFVNAFNFMDGINGISGLQVFVGAGFLAAMGHHFDQNDVIVAGLAVCGAALGFLPFNIVRARIFLGDVGSYFLGAWLAGLALLTVLGGAPVLVAAAPFLLYVGDTTAVLVRRAMRHESLMTAHREHAYQRLVQLGLGHPTVAVICAGVSALCCMVMYAVIDRNWVTQVIALIGCAMVIGAYVASPDVFARSRRITGVGRA